MESMVYRECVGAVRDQHPEALRLLRSRRALDCARPLPAASAGPCPDPCGAPSPGSS
jgi:hypothetical protein